MIKMKTKHKKHACINFFSIVKIPLVLFSFIWCLICCIRIVLASTTNDTNVYHLIVDHSELTSICFEPSQNVVQIEHSVAIYIYFCILVKKNCFFFFKIKSWFFCSQIKNKIVKHAGFECQLIFAGCFLGEKTWLN